MASKFSAEAGEEVREWIGQVLGEPVPAGDIFDVLKDGILLCRVVNTIEPGIAKSKASGMPFVQMENIAAFLRACDKIGVPHHELFETVDLFERQNTFQVITTLRSLSRHAHNKNEQIPVLGPKLNKNAASSSPRQFNPQNIPAWNTRQYGFLGGASQSSEGVVIGGTRNISIGVQSPTSRGSTNKPKSSVFEDQGKKNIARKRRPFVSDDDSKSVRTRTPVQQRTLDESDQRVDPATLLYDEAYDALSKNKTNQHDGFSSSSSSSSRYMEEMKRAKRQRDQDRVIAQDTLVKRQRQNQPETEEEGEVFVTSAYKAQQAQIAETLAKEQQDRNYTNRTKTGLYTIYNEFLEHEDSRAKAQPHQQDIQSTSPLPPPPPPPPPKEGLNEEGEVIDDKKTLKGGLNIISAAPQQPVKEPETTHKTLVEEPALSRVELARLRFLQRKKDS